MSRAALALSAQALGCCIVEKVGLLLWPIEEEWQFVKNVATEDDLVFFIVAGNVSAPESSKP